MINSIYHIITVIAKFDFFHVLISFVTNSWIIPSLVNQRMG